MNPVISIDAAAKSDLAAVFLLEQQVFGSHSYPDFFFRQVFDCWHDGLMLARDSDSGRLAGYQLAVRAANPEDFWILSLAVDSEYRGKGIGKQLIRAGISAVPDGVKRVMLTVSPDNPARCLYEAEGFVEIGFEDDYFGPGEGRMLMALQL
ncbi:GNAT family N-acetyltransferase [Shewanella submarina]|uniref:GNAT family N-acetyltransferase n=1 Tax=Shewanella submarina TaxID=2016376 RepID=A0ABV7G9M6_9GAMM|nr:N-acetyltransferase [Shewanella submarina]MCL1039588.1 GNAT family N-acetyltransferase [Shewanella submarina]